MSEKKVPDWELDAIVRDVRVEDQWFEFYQIQDGYADGIPWAVFITEGGNPMNIPMIITTRPMMDAIGRLAADLCAERALLRRIVAEWRASEVGDIDGAVIEEVEALLGIKAEPDPLAVKDTEKPPLVSPFSPGSLASGSKTEDEILDRQRRGQ